MKHDEYDFQVAVVKYLVSKGVSCFMVPNHLLKNGLAELKRETAAGFRKGAPDLIAGINGKCYWLELKTPTGRQSIEQMAFQQQAPRFGAKYIVVRTLDDLREII